VGSEQVRARLVADTAAFVPGEEHLVGVSLEIADGWHVYAVALNDTGSPLSVHIESPPGYAQQTAPAWPAPERHVTAGDLLDHVYERQVTLPLRVTVPADAAPGTAASFRAHVDWFVCKDVCIAGGADVSLSVPIAAAGADAGSSADEPLLRAAQARLPLPLPSAGVPVTLELSGDTLNVRAPGAAGLAFVPDPDCAPPEHLLEDGERAGDALALRLRPEREPGALVSGVLEVRWRDRPSAFYLVRVPAGPPAGSAPASRAPEAPSH